MKIRMRFVSNSSSSSFIVFGQGEVKIPDWTQKYYIFGNDGNKEFGWEFRRYDTIWDKINFCYVQARDIQRMDWIELLEAVIRKTGLANIGWDLPKYEIGSYDETIDYAYIDHQSSSTEGRNIEMFESEETLTNFLFNPNSYIQGGNDNV